MRQQHKILIIQENISIADIRAAKPKMIYYSARTCWFTHKPEHLSTLPARPGEVEELAQVLRLNSATPDAQIDEFLERAKKAARGLPCDPLGSVLFQTDNVEGFLKSAEQNAAHYGKHGLRAFIAAHHENCFNIAGQNWASVDWADYNAALDWKDSANN